MSNQELLGFSISLTAKQKEYCRIVGGGFVSRGAQDAIDFHRKYGDFIAHMETVASAVNKGIIPVDTVGDGIMAKFNTIEEGR